MERTGDAGLEGGGSAHEGGGAGLGTGRRGRARRGSWRSRRRRTCGRSLLCFETAAVVAGAGEWAGERGDRDGRVRRTRARGVKTSLRRVSLEVDDDRRRRRGERRARLGRDPRPRPRSSSRQGRDDIFWVRTGVPIWRARFGVGHARERDARGDAPSAPVSGETSRARGPTLTCDKVRDAAKVVSFLPPRRAPRLGAA